MNLHRHQRLPSTLAVQALLETQQILKEIPVNITTPTLKTVATLMPLISMQQNSAVHAAVAKTRASQKWAATLIVQSVTLVNTMMEVIPQPANVARKEPQQTAQVRHQSQIALYATKDTLSPMAPAQLAVSANIRAVPETRHVQIALRDGIKLRQDQVNA